MADESASTASNGSATAPNGPQLASATTRSNPLPRADLLRRLGVVMLLRVLLVTLLLGGTVGVHLALGTPEELASPHSKILFTFIIAVYLLSIAYAALVRLIVQLERVAIAQLGIDLLFSAVLVHLTGSADSAFVLFFLLTPVTAAVTLRRRSSAYVALLGSALLVGTVLTGYYQLLPIVPGQVRLPWDVAPALVARSLIVNCSVMFVVAALADYLAEHLRRVATHVREQQAYLADLSALHENVVRCLTSGLITVDTLGRVLTVNHAATEILGTEAARLAGQPLKWIAPGLAALAGNPNTMLRRAETMVELDGNTHILGVSVSPLTDRDNQRIGLILNFQDLTTLRQLELTIRQSEHMAALGRVAAGAAHEIRNPLASISGSLELLRDDVNIHGENRRLMDIALREIDRLEKLIADLLNYARPSAPPDTRKMDIGAQIHPLVADISSLSTAADAPAVVVVDCSEGLWVRADRDRIRGLLWNLVRNSAQAGEREKVEVCAGRDDTGDVFLRVSDHGQGIDPEHVRHIFEPFFTTKSDGRGLGLSVVHRTVQDHGGRIEVESVPGEGTTVTVVLPQVPAPTPQES